MTMAKDSPDFAVSKKRILLPFKGTDLMIYPLLPGLRSLTGEKSQRYLASELRDRIKQTGVTVKVIDRTGHNERWGSGQANLLILLNTSKIIGVFWPYVAFFDPKKRDIGKSSSPHQRLYCPLYPPKVRYRANFRRYFYYISYHYNMLSWPDPWPSCTCGSARSVAPPAPGTGTGRRCACKWANARSGP